MRSLHGCLLPALLAGAAGCDCYSAHSPPAPCAPGERCVGGVHEVCVGGEVVSEDCAAQGLACVDGIGCAPCRAGDSRCDGPRVEVCEEGGWRLVEECDGTAGLACADGACLSLCDAAAAEGATTGCEFWAADLDLASTGGGDSAAGTLAVVVTNTSGLDARVSVFSNRAEYGAPLDEGLVSEEVVASGDLAVIELPRAEVDGSPDATGSALTARAFRIASSVPVGAVQVNAAEGAGPGGSDASTLLPSARLGTRHVAMSWPQTIADTDDPDTDFGTDYRSFLAIVGTAAGTRVTVTAKARPLPLPQLPDLEIRVNEPFEVVLGPHEVLNLETDGFGEDLTGTVIDASAPVAVFSGSEAADVPAWETMGERLCCGGHLEEQLVPSGSLGTSYACVLAPQRGEALLEAGARGPVVDEPVFVRVLAVEPGTTRVETSLPAPDDLFVLVESGHRTLRADEDFTLDSDEPVAVAQLVGGQGTTGVSPTLPAGAPSFVLLPPVERWSASHAFAVPTGFVLDFATVISGPGALPTLDEAAFPEGCEATPIGDAALEVRRCRLSTPEVREDEVDPGTGRTLVLPGGQPDGLHVMAADAPFGLLVHGFDWSRAYGYSTTP